MIGPSGATGVLGPSGATGVLGPSGPTGATGPGLIPGIIVITDTRASRPGYVDIGRRITSNTDNGYLETIPGMPMPRAFTSGAAFNNAVYVIGGSSNGIGSDPYMNLVQRYDVGTNTWVANLAKMPTARYGAAIAGITNRIYVIGGWDGARDLNVNEYYDAVQNRWFTVRPLPEPKSGASCAVIGTDIYVLGGGVSSRVTNPLHRARFSLSLGTTSYRYSATTDQWTPVPAVPIPIVAGNAVALGRRIYIIGAYTEKLDYAPSFMLDLDTNRWQEIVGPGLPLLWPGVALINNQIDSIGGLRQYFCVGAVSETTPVSNVWRRLAPTLTAPRIFAATAVVGDTFYVMGGIDYFSSNPAVNVCERLRPAGLEFYLFRKI